jgi:hypothetical protein
VYANEVGGLELFLRAATEKGFEPLGLLLDLRSREDLVELLSSEAMPRILHAETFCHADVFLDSLVGAGLLRRQ